MTSPLAGPALTLLLVLPWIAPLSAGPWRNGWPYLISAACLAGLLLLRRHWQPQQIARAWLLGALLSCVFALVQYFGWAAHWAPWIATIGPGEGSGNLRQRNQLASLTGIGLVCLTYLLAQARESRAPRRWAMALAALTLLALGNAVTSSRTGALAWAMVLAISLGYSWRSGQRSAALVPAIGLAIYLCASTLMPAALEWTLAQRGAPLPCANGPCNALERLAASGSDSRIALWRNVIDLIALRPWSGWGWNELNYAHYITLFTGERFSEKLGNAHNLPLQLAVELGLPTALGVCAALLLAIWRARPWREVCLWRQAAWGVLAVIGLHSLLEYPLWYGPFQIAMLVCVLALALGTTRSHSAADHAAPELARFDRWVDALALGLLLVIAVVAFDYHRTSQIYLPAHQRHSAYRDRPMEAARASWFFQDHADFARLALTPLRAENAVEQLRLAQELLHHSAEPLVIERLLDSAALLGHNDLLAFHRQRYEAAYPQAYAKWLERQSTATRVSPTNPGG